jgi:hypothetical protein
MRDFLGHAIDEIAALDVDRLADAVRRRLGDAEFLLDALGGGFTDQQVVMAAHIGNDRLVHLVAADAHRCGVGKAAQRQHRDLGRAAADIDNHRSDRLRHRHVGADRGGHRFLDQEHLARARIARGVTDRATLDEVEPEGTQITISGIAPQACLAVNLA